MLSLKDHTHIQSRFLTEDVLSVIKADDEQSQIFDHACLIEHVISFIHMFLKDMKYLELSVRILKKLLLRKCKDFMSQHFSALHSEQTKVKMQMSEFIYEN